MLPLRLSRFSLFGDGLDANFLDFHMTRTKRRFSSKQPPTLSKRRLFIRQVWM